MSNLTFGLSDIPFRATAVYSSEVFASSTPVSNIAGGSRGQFAELLAKTRGQVDIEFDNGVNSDLNFISILRAKILKYSGITGIVLRGANQSAFIPQQLANLKLWIDGAKRISVDTAQTVNAAADRTPASVNTFTQATLADKPYQSRADNLSNLFAQSELQTDAAWSKLSTTVSTTAIASPLGFAKLVLEDASVASHYVVQSVKVYAGQSYRVSALVKRRERNVRLHIDDGTNKYQAYFNLTTGALNNTVGTGASATIDPVVGFSGWYKVTLTATPAASGAAYTGIAMTNDAFNENYSGNVANGLYVDGMQVSETNADTTYLKTNTEIQHPGINGNRVLRFDSSDNLASAAAIASLNLSGGAFTVFAVVKPMNPSASQTYNIFNCEAGSVNGYLYRLEWDVTTQKYLVKFRSNQAGTSTSSNSSKTIDVRTTTVLTAQLSGGTVSHFKNGVANGSSALTNPVAHTLPFRISVNSTEAMQGATCEIIIYDSVLTAGERQLVEGYLINKWITAPAYSNFNVNTLTLEGGKDQDFFAFPASPGLFRFWNLQLDAPLASSMRLPKIYFGAKFDLGRDPIFTYELNQPLYQDKDARTPRNFHRVFEGLTEAKLIEFEQRVGKYRNEGYFSLLTDTDNSTLFGLRGMHTRLIDYSVIRRLPLRFDLDCNFEEVV